VQGLITRLLGASYVASFTLETIPVDPTGGLDVFELGWDSQNSRPLIRGSAGYAIASGLNWYLKYTVNASFAWGRDGSGNQLSSVPAAGSQFPRPATLRMVSAVTFRYAYNVCTYGYTMAFWNTQQFYEEIDRLALWGVNLPLAFQAQEATEDRVYRAAPFSMNSSEINAYLAGPAFLPWQRMGNMRAWGGPLSPNWHVQQKAMQVLLINRMRSFGMVPVLAGFAGHVPDALETHFPNSSFTHSSDWCGFDPKLYGADTLLEATDPLFQTLGSAMNAATLADFGDPTGLETPIFNADMYNEMEPNNADPAYLAQCNAAIYTAMTSANPKALYLMQAWLFHSDFWTYDRVKAFLSGVPIGKMILLDLNSEAGPVWNQYDSFFGHTCVSIEPLCPTNPPYPPRSHRSLLFPQMDLEQPDHLRRPSRHLRQP
jgi:alpha-N-acetylglucosaminidase